MPAAKLKSVQCDSLTIPGGELGYVYEAEQASLVRVDFWSRHAVAAPANAPIGEALEHPEHKDARCAFVADMQEKTVVGIITAYDISGQKPRQYMDSTEVSRGVDKTRSMAALLA